MKKQAALERVHMESFDRVCQVVKETVITSHKVVKLSEPAGRICITHYAHNTGETMKPLIVHGFDMITRTLRATRQQLFGRSTLIRRHDLTTCVHEFQQFIFQNCTGVIKSATRHSQTHPI